jgi:hypothetical protein
MSIKCATQNDLLLQNLRKFYSNEENLHKMISVINGESQISLRIVDWFVTNYSKKHFIVYTFKDNNDSNVRLKVYNDYKLKLKAYSKRRFDPFCRWERIQFQIHDNKYVETTIGQLNFFKWSIENKILEYIKDNYEKIETDMNHRNTTARILPTDEVIDGNKKTRKKREELSISATKCIKKETVKITVSFN